MYVELCMSGNAQFYGVQCERGEAASYKLMYVCYCSCRKGNLGQAELIGREALKLLPNDHTIMFSLANVLGKLQKYKVSHHHMKMRLFALRHMT